MRALLVIDAQPLLGDVLHLLDALEHVGDEHLVPIGAAKPLDVGVLIGLTRLDVVELESNSGSRWATCSTSLANATGSEVSEARSALDMTSYFFASIVVVLVQPFPRTCTRVLLAMAALLLT